MNIFLYATIYTTIQFVKNISTYIGFAHNSCTKKYIKFLYSYLAVLVMINLFVLARGVTYLSTFTIIFGLIAPLICTEDNKVKSGIVYFIISSATYLIDSYIFTVTMYIVSDKYTYLVGNRTYNILNILITLPIALIILIVGVNSKNTDHESEDLKEVLPQYLLVLAGTICCYFVVFGTQRTITNVVSESELTYTFIFTTGACIIFFLIGIWQLKVTYSRNFYKKKEAYQQDYIQMQDNYYKEILNKDNQMRSFRHDMRSHMVAIKELTDKNDLNNLRAYTQTILDNLDMLKLHNYSGNHIIDAVVSDIMQSLEGEQIELTWNGQLAEDINIERFDLCTVISNVMKNAVEACKKIPIGYKRYIIVNTSMFKDTLLISVENPISQPVKMLNGRPKTNKKNPSLHGYGTLNIENAAKKYNGAVKYFSESGLFRIEILMHQLIKSDIS